VSPAIVGQKLTLSAASVCATTAQARLEEGHRIENAPLSEYQMFQFYLTQRLN